AEFRPEDCRRLFPCNFAGSTMVDLAERWWLEASPSGDTVRGHVNAGVPVRGPFIFTARLGADPIVVYEGTHRMAAWVIQAKQGFKYRISADVISTRGVDPLRATQASARCSRGVGGEP